MRKVTRRSSCSSNHVCMREEYGLAGAESGPLVIWAIGVPAREIRAGNLPELPRRATPSRVA